MKTPFVQKFSQGPLFLLAHSFLQTLGIVILISMATFIHLSLDHELGQIQFWINEHNLGIIFFSRIFSLLLLYYFLEIRSHQKETFVRPLKYFKRAWSLKILSLQLVGLIGLYLLFFILSPLKGVNVDLREIGTLMVIQWSDFYLLFLLAYFFKLGPGQMVFLCLIQSSLGPLIFHEFFDSAVMRGPLYPLYNVLILLPSLQKNGPDSNAFFVCLLLWGPFFIFFQQNWEFLTLPSEKIFLILQIFCIFLLLRPLWPKSPLLASSP